MNQNTPQDAQKHPASAQTHQDPCHEADGSHPTPEDPAIRARIDDLRDLLERICPPHTTPKGDRT